MATNTYGGAKGCTFQWKVENVGHWWWLKKGERINSPVFIADALEGTKWSLRLDPIGYADEIYVGFFLCREDCSGPDDIEIHYQLSFLRKDGSILKERTPSKHTIFHKFDWGFSKFEERERVFLTERETFLPEDTLTVQCTMWTTDEKPNKSKISFANSTIKVKRRSFVWKIDKPNTLKSDIRNRFKDNLIDLNLILNEGLDRLNMEMTLIDEIIKYVSCKTSIIESEGRKENCEIKKYFPSDLKKGVLSSTLLFPKMVLENKSQYFPNDVLSLDFELVIATVEHFECRKNSVILENEVTGEWKSQNPAVLIDDFKSLYNDGIFSDMELRTSTKTFPAHKAILSARSPVFRSMFSNDMKEKNNGHVDITDFDDDTIHRMLLYIYTDSLEDLHFESASKLYTIADKYLIPTLKSRCSSFLKENLSPINVCEVLLLAVLHHDDDLKSPVEDYVLGRHKQFFGSKEWKDFMSSHVTLAADIMQRKIMK